jgi:hypothetical protein
MIELVVFLMARYDELVVFPMARYDRIGSISYGKI